MSFPKRFLPVFLFLLGAGFCCKKSANGHATPPPATDYAVANGYLTDGYWRYAGQRYPDSDIYHPILIDTIKFSLEAQIDDHSFSDTVTGYFQRIITFTGSEFHVSSDSLKPDTLISVFTPFTFGTNRLDSFLVKNLSDSMFVLQQISAEGNNGYPFQEDTMRKFKDWVMP